MNAVSNVAGSRWKVKDLTYKISKYPRNLKRDLVDMEVKKAFGVWTEYTDLTFTPKKVGSVSSSQGKVQFWVRCGSDDISFFRLRCTLRLDSKEVNTEMAILSTVSEEL